MGQSPSWRRPCWREPQVRRPSPATGWLCPILSTATRTRTGPSPRALAAIRDVAPSAAHEYPDERLKHLRSTIASFHNVRAEQVVIGCGSTEILRMAADAFLAPNQTLVTARPSCEVIADFAVSRGARVAAIPLLARHSCDLPAMLAACTSATGLVYICNPNNPTGTVTRRQDLDEFLQRLPARPTVLIDEAYLGSVAQSPDSASFIARPAARDRVIVVEASRRSMASRVSASVTRLPLLRSLCV